MKALNQVKKNTTSGSEGIESQPAMENLPYDTHEKSDNSHPFINRHTLELWTLINYYHCWWAIRENSKTN